MLSILGKKFSGQKFEIVFLNLILIIDFDNLHEMSNSTGDVQEEPQSQNIASQWY